MCRQGVEILGGLPAVPGRAGILWFGALIVTPSPTAIAARATRPTPAASTCSRSRRPTGPIRWRRGAPSSPTRGSAEDGCGIRRAAQFPPYNCRLIVFLVIGRRENKLPPDDATANGISTYSHTVHGGPMKAPADEQRRVVTHKSETRISAIADAARDGKQKSELPCFAHRPGEFARAPANSSVWHDAAVRIVSRAPRARRPCVRRRGCGPRPSAAPTRRHTGDNAYSR